MAKGRKIDYRNFEDAREFARSLDLRNKDEWTRYAKGELEGHDPKPKDIPSRVDKIYKGKGWAGFDDFLSSKKVKEIRKSFKSFDAARNFARALKLTTEEDWKEYLEGKGPASKFPLPIDVPPQPDDIYKDKGWCGWKDWLSDHYSPDPIVYQSFEEARAFVQNLKFKNIHEWESYRNGEDKVRGECPKGIPVWPPRAYKEKGWESWGDWLGLTIGKKKRL